jgi:glycosyltransferase involved in cell wall biosynthesis
MRLLVVSYKTCWPHRAAPSGYATDGGFPLQMQALAELFDATTLLLPCTKEQRAAGETALHGHNLSVVPLPPLTGRDLRRKLNFPFWLLRNLPLFIGEMRRADAVHAPIPGDVGTIGILLALALRKPLFVRHCGNWLAPRTIAERFWKWLLEFIAGGRNVCLATGGAAHPPARNPNIKWIFATTLTTPELVAYAQPRQLVPTRPPRLIIVCRQEHLKGTSLLIETLPLLATQFPGINCDVVGNGTALDDFKERAQQLRLDDQVTFHGQCNHERVMQLLRNADLFCFPTAASEGFPKAVLEALACGLPVITTPVSVLPQLLAHGGGVLLNERTPQALVAAVTETLCNADRYRAMSEQALLTAREYSLERWRDVIGAQLQSAWSASLRNESDTDFSMCRIAANSSD